MTQRSLPFVMPPIDVFFASPKKIFTHFFYPFPLSFDNLPATSDYYQTQYLTIEGEKGKHNQYGGYLDVRPLDTGAPNQAANWKDLYLRQQIILMMARGITGVCFDILNLGDAESLTGNLNALLKAAFAVDTRFKVMPMLDMSSMTGLTPVQAETLISSFTHPSIARHPDGRLRIAAFNASIDPLSWWQTVIAAENAVNVDIAFIPILLGSPATNPLASISEGMGWWGTAIPSAESAAPAFMNPVLPQQCRRKNQKIWEASNTTAFIDGMMASITGGADMIQLVTWNDYSECGQVSPYTDATLDPTIGTAFYDLTGYYATWFATGEQPTITQDVLYWCYRRMNSSATHLAQPLSFSFVSSVEESNIELLGFLTIPGTLMINGIAKDCDAGITSFKQPTVPGFPKFALQRNGSDVFRFSGPVWIYGAGGWPKGTQDLTYWGGSHAAF